MNRTNLYKNPAAFAADTEGAALADKNVYLIESNAKVGYRGKNIIVPVGSARPGDALVYDKVQQKLVAIKAGTYSAADLGTDFINHELVCFGEMQDKVLFTPKNILGGGQFGYGDVYKIEPNYVSGGGFSITIKSAGADAANTKTSVVTYPALATPESIIAQITLPSYASAERGYDNCIRIVVGGWSANCGVTLADATGDEEVVRVNPERYQITHIPEGMSAYSSIKRNKGLTTWYAGMNFGRFLEYYGANGSQAQNLAENSTDILHRSAFNPTDNATLYNKYNGDYEAYVRGEMLAWPDNANCFAQWDGKLDTDILDSFVFTDCDANQTMRHGYPAAHSARAFGYVDAGYTTGMEPGNFYLPSAYQTKLQMESIDHPNYNDPFSKTVIAMNGNTHRVGSYHAWTSTLYSGAYAWGFYSVGGLSSTGRFYTRSVRPVLALRKTY